MRMRYFKVFGFLFLLLLYVMGDAEAACVRNFPSVHFTPTAGIMAASSTKGYTVTIMNNDKEDTPGGCGSSTFTLSIVPESNPGSFVIPSTLGSISTGPLNPGQRYYTTLTVTTAGAITEGHKLTTIVQAVDNTNHSGKTGKGSIVTKASVYKGEGNILRRAEEEMCHSCHKTDRNRTPSDADWNEAIKTHNSTALGSSKWSAQGGWGVAGGKYGEFVCTTCHTAHDTVNIYIIKETITTPDSSNWDSSGTPNVSIDFRKKSGVTGEAGLMGDDSDASRLSSSRVCEVCHTLPNYHKYNQATDPGHYNAQDCTGCHSHKIGFGGAGACDACHGAPPGSGTDNNAPAQYAASHTKHYDPTAGGVPTSYTTATIRSTATAYVFDCGRCHSTNSGDHGTAENNGIVNVELNAGTGGTFVPGDYTGGDNPPPPGSVTFKNSSGTCSSTYCHGNYPGSGLNATPTWGNTSSGACGTCHGASNTTTPASGAHKRHASSGLTGGRNDREYACTLCHKDIVGGSGPSSYTISDKVKHVSGKVDWKFDIVDSRVSGTSAYSIVSGTAVPSDGTTPRAYGTCSNVYCHSNVQPNDGVGAPSSYDTPNWKATINCSSRCHAPADISYFHGTTIASGSHSQHMAYTFNSYKINRCTLCHKWNSAAAGNFNPPFDGTTCTNQCHFSSEKTLHADGSINVMFDTYFGSGVYNGASAPGNGYSNCSNTYCHSDGTSVSTDSIPNNTSANWGSGALACSACHGNPPNYTSGSPKTNSHAKHSGYLCNKCHVNTTSDGSTITNKGNHVNKAYNVNAGAGALFTYSFLVTGGTCSSISCHSYGNATWGGTVACGGCHALPPATGKHLAHTDGTGAAYGNDNNDSVAGTYRFNCGNCHPFDGAKHGDGTVDVELYNASATGFKQYNPLGAGVKSGSGDTTVCENIYCHSNGADGGNRAYKETPTWSSTFGANKCGQCHDNPPQYAGQSHYNATGFMGKEGGHLVGIHFDNIYTGTTGLASAGTGNTDSHGNSAYSTTITCYICHNGEVSSAIIDTYALNNLGSSSMKCSTASCHTAVSTPPLQNGAITNKSLHVNAAKNVTIAPAFTMKSKAQLRNSSLPAQWTRFDVDSSGNLSAGDYKTAVAYDSATLNSVDWNGGTKTCTTACHQDQPVQWGDTTVTCNSCHKDLP